MVIEVLNKEYQSKSPPAFLLLECLPEQKLGARQEIAKEKLYQSLAESLLDIGVRYFYKTDIRELFQTDILIGLTSKKNILKV